LPDFFLSHVWAGIVAWTILYISDMTMTMSCARLYRQGAGEKIVFEGSFELNPLFQRDVDSLRWMSKRFLWMLLLTDFLLALVWWLDRQSSIYMYPFLLGSAICLQLAIHVRHLRNLFLFRAIEGSDAARGRIEYSRPLILRMSSVEFLAFAGLFGLLFVFTGSWFVMGGAFACFLTAGKHWWLARRQVVSKPS
jgi:hypothetical protein